MSSIYKICDEEGGGGGEEGRGAPITQLKAAPPTRRITKLWLRENNKNNFRKKQLPPTINWRIIWDWKMLTF